MLSVIVPYWQRQAALDRMFRNYAEVYGPLPLEFSVCDDGDPTPARPRPVVGAPHRVVLTRLPEKRAPLNPCVPLNRAVAESHGEIVVITNPEIEHREPVLTEMLSLLRDPLDYVVARCWDSRGFYVAGPDVKFNERGRLPVPPGGQFHFCAMLHRSLWERAGGFDEDYRHVQGCDDNDWLFRLHRAGARFRMTAGQVYHEASGVRWGLPHGRDLFMKKWPEAMQ